MNIRRAVMNNGITIWVWKVGAGYGGSDKGIIAFSVNPDDLEATGLSYEDFYRRTQTSYPSSEGFKVTCEAERTEKIQLDFDGPLRLEEPIILDHVEEPVFLNKEFLGY